MIRDPRAVHASLKNVDWNKGNPTVNSERWRWYAQRVRQWVAKKPQNITVISYESLVRDPANTLADLGLWLGLQLDVKASSRASVQTAGFNGAAEPWKLFALQPPDPARIAGWREQLSAPEVATVERWARREMGRFGYQTEQPFSRRTQPHEWHQAWRIRTRLFVYALATRIRVAFWGLRRH